MGNVLKFQKPRKLNIELGGRNIEDRQNINLKNQKYLVTIKMYMINVELEMPFMARVRLVLINPVWPFLLFIQDRDVIASESESFVFLIAKNWTILQTFFDSSIRLFNLIQFYLIVFKPKMNIEAIIIFFQNEFCFVFMV